MKEDTIPFLIYAVSLAMTLMWLMYMYHRGWRPFAKWNHAKDWFTGAMFHGRKNWNMRTMLRLMIGHTCLLGVGFLTPIGNRPELTRVSVVILNIEFGIWRDIDYIR